MAKAISDSTHELSPPLPIDSPVADTPPSTQDTELSSDSAEQTYDRGTVKTKTITVDADDNTLETTTRITKPQIKAQARVSMNGVASRPAASDPSSPRMISVAERPKQILRA